MRTAIGVDIGGTNLSVGLVSDTGEVLELVRERTPVDGSAAADLLIEMTRRLLAAVETPVGIGLGFGGPVNFTDQSIVRSHHVDGWAPGLKLGDRFAQEFGLPTLMDNDANCGGLGETVFGAARGCGSVVYVNVGTGIGGAVLLGGRLHHGAHSTAGEIGHTVVVPGGPLCTCDKHGCLEALSSGSALGREGRAAGLGDVTGKAVGERALAGDPVALQVVAQAGHWLGVSTGNLASLLDPEVFVIGGGVSDLGDIFLGPAREAFAATAMPAAAATPLVKAQFGYDAGVIGAAALMLAPDSP